VAERKWVVTGGDWVEYVTSRGHVARRPALVRNERWKPTSERVIDTKPKDYIELWLRQGGFCGLCWEPLDPHGWDSGDPDAITIDHIVPQSWGGDDCLMNTQAVHRRCNSAKGNRSSDVSWLHDDFPGRQDVEFPRTAFAEETMSLVRGDWLYMRRFGRES
jgi:5-methylcytosine-specific restriction endonuclease McrA